MDDDRGTTAPATPADAGVVGRLLWDFNTEFETETPSAEEFAARFARLLGRDDVVVLLPGGARPARVRLPDAPRPRRTSTARWPSSRSSTCSPTCATSGIGTALLERALDMCRERDAGEMHINVDEDDTDTRRFYERHGFLNILPAATTGCCSTRSSSEDGRLVVEVPTNSAARGCRIRTRPVRGVGETHLHHHRRRSTMRTLVVTEFMSLDGVVDSPGGESGYPHSGWTFKDVRPDMAAYELKGREQEEAGALLVGRVSWDAFHEVWPTMKEFARYNEIPKYVVSTTLDEQDVAASPWKPATLLRSMDDVAALKQTDGGEIQVHGSARAGPEPGRRRAGRPLPPARLPAGARHGGKRLFADDGRQGQAELVEHASYSNGIQKLCYDVVR